MTTAERNGKASGFKVKATAGAGVDLRDFLRDEVYPRLSAEVIFSDSAHKWKETSADKLKGGCPWHHSDSGTAFYVQTTAPFLWRCAGCNIGGDALSYVWKLRYGSQAQTPTGRDFIDAVRELAQLAGVPFAERQVSPQAAARLRVLQAREAILADVYLLCREKLLSAEGEHAREYLRQRGINDAWQQELQLGLYPPTNELREKLLARGHRMEAILASSVVLKKVVGYCTFPWLDESGRSLTLYGHWPGNPPADSPKTIALPNPTDADGVAIEHTKRAPFCLDRAVRAGMDRLVLVEGLLDAAVLHAQGEASAIACVAAHLSNDQVETLVRRRIKEVTICLDPDKAGDNNICGNVVRLRAAGITPYVAPRLPDGLDPDDFALQHGVEEWRRRITRKVHGYRHIAQNIIAEQGAREPGDDSWSDRIIEAALKFASKLPPEHDEELTRHFWSEITQATGSCRDDLRKRLVIQRKQPGSTPGAAVEWPAMVALPDVPDAPAFPLDALPADMAGLVEEIGWAMNCAPDLAGVPAGDGRRWHRQRPAHRHHRHPHPGPLSLRRRGCSAWDDQVPSAPAPAPALRRARKGIPHRVGKGDGGVAEAAREGQRKEGQGQGK